MYKGNKAEWSELYAFLKIIGGGFIAGADDKINQIDDWKYPVAQVIRGNLDKLDLVYAINSELGVVNIYSGGKYLASIKQTVVLDHANKILSSLQSKQRGTFQIPDIEKFLNELCKPKMKTSSSKRDITVAIKDFNNNLQREVGFSIKSEIGGSSTLFNAGK